MSRKVSSKRVKAVKSSPRGGELPFSESVGYQIRATHRSLQRYLQMKLEPYDVSLGSWYFLRALWNDDGLSQRELSRRARTTEPTTLSAIVAMEQKGLVHRIRDTKDLRKLHVWLTPKGRELEVQLLPLAKDVVSTATQGLTKAEVKGLLASLLEVQKNLHATMKQFDEINT